MVDRSVSDRLRLRSSESVSRRRALVAGISVRGVPSLRGHIRRVEMARNASPTERKKADRTGRPSRTVRRHGPAPCLSPPSSSSPGPAPASAPAAAQQSCPAAIATGTSDEDTSREFRTQSVCNARSPRGGAYHVLDQGLLPEELLLGNPELAQRLLSGGVFHLSRAVISGKTTVHV